MVYLLFYAQVTKGSIIPHGSGGCISNLVDYPPKIYITGTKMSATETELFNLRVLGLDAAYVLKLPRFVIKGNVIN